MNCQSCGVPLSPGASSCPNCEAWVAPGGAPRVHLQRADAARAEHFAGRGWVLRQVAEWMGRRAERFLLILGKPGAGKTALAAWLAGAGDAGSASDAPTLERVRAAWSAAHFCAAAGGRGGTVNPDSFSKSLAEQFSDRFGDYGAAVLHHNGPNFRISQHATVLNGKMIGALIQKLIVNSNFEDTYHRVVRQPLKDVFRRKSKQPVFVLVDALDESMAFGRVNIATLLAGSDDLPANVRFVLTSRDDDDVTELFPSARLLDLSDPKYTDEVNADIRAYVERRLAGDAGAGLPAGVSRADVAGRIVAEADKNFLYTKILLDEMAEGSRSASDLSGLPAGLYALYRAYLDRLMSEKGRGVQKRWEKTYQPLLGCLSVAVPAGPHEVLHGWLGQKSGAVNEALSNVSQITETTSDYGQSYKLYHRSLAEFLAADLYKERGKTKPNSYYTPPPEMHDRIASYYLKNFEGDWSSCDDYGLRQLVGHLLGRLPAAAGTQRAKWREAVYNVVLDKSFRLAQRNSLGDIQTTLADLRAALSLALAQDEPLRVLACVGAYREATRNAGLSREIFAALGQQDFARALLLADYYGSSPKPFGTWARVLYLYLALEAAEAGDVESVRRAAQGAREVAWTLHVNELCQALAARTARTLASVVHTPRGAEGWLSELLPDEGDWPLRNFTPAVPLRASERADLLTELRNQRAEMERISAEWSAEHGGSLPGMFFDAEAIAHKAGQYVRVLARLAAAPADRKYIDESLPPVLSNPYLQYRDIAASAIGTAVLAAPDFSWARERMQRILAATLDNEGVTFTYDLPTVLQAELARRKRRTPELDDYLARAMASDDPWGTRTRVLSARAAVLFRQEKKDEAFDLLRSAVSGLRGFAGYQTQHLLSLINRWAEFGHPDPGGQPGVSNRPSLLSEATDQAQQVRDPTFSDQRVKLVQSYRKWLDEGAPGLEEVRARLSAMRDPDMRRAYKDFVSARWAAGTDRESLKQLTPLTLADATTLDAVLGRLYGLWAGEMSDKELDQAALICAAELTVGRPWELNR